MSLPNYLSAIKSAGIYRFVWDKSEIEGVDAETLRLVVGYSEKGPFNTPVYVKSASDFKTIFGGISRKLEKRGVFFHRLALQALLSGPIIALNLKKFSNTPGKDEVQGVTLDASNSKVLINDIKDIPVEGIYDTVRFWNLSPETARESYASISGQTTKYISIFATDDSSTSKSFIIRGYKPTGFDLSIKQWYSNMGEEMPDIYKPIENTLLNQYFAEIYVFEGEFSTAIAKSKELSKYFTIENSKVMLKPYIVNAFGEKVDTLATLSADKNSNFVKMYRGITLPEFKDSNNNYISLNLIFNTDQQLHKMMMDFNTDLIDGLNPEDENDTQLLLNYLNTAGWYSNALIGNGNTGLQACMNYIYNNVNITNNVNEEYYDIETGINILGNANIVPDADIMLTVDREIYNTNSETTVSETKPETLTKDDMVIAQTSDTGVFYVNSGVYTFNGTDTVSFIGDTELTDANENETTFNKLFRNNNIISIDGKLGTQNGDMLYATNGSDLIIITTNIDTETTYTYKLLTNSEFIDTLTPPTNSVINTCAIQHIYNTSSVVHTILKLNITTTETVNNEPVETTSTGYYMLNLSGYPTSTVLSEVTDPLNYSEWTSSDKHTFLGLVDSTELWTGEDMVLRKTDGIKNIFAFKIANSAALYLDGTTINSATVDTNDKYLLQYITMSVSSDSENGGDVKFLTMNKCYDENDNLIQATPSNGSWNPPTNGYKVIITDSFVNYGLTVGDQFLAKDGKVAILLSIEEVENGGDSSAVPTMKYTFNEEVQLMCLEFDDDDNPSNGNELYQLILTKFVNPFSVSLSSDMQFTYLKGFEYSNPKPASTSQRDKLKWQWSILDALTEYRGLRTGLTEKKDIDYRYIIDTFEGFVESELKSRLSLLAKEKDSCLAILNFPAIETFRKCTYTSFTDDKGQLDTKYIAEGGNSRKTIGSKFSLPSETNGASWCSFNTCVVLSDGTVKTTIPSAALVSNNFMEKYVSRQPYYIVAGPNYGRIVDYQLVGPDFNFGRADLDVLEPFGVNCMVYVPRIGTYINSNQTAKQNPVTALSKINIRELVIYLQDEIEKLLQSYQWEFNNQTLRDVIKTKADTICENVKNNGGLYEYLNVCDSSNNPPEVVDNEMLVLSTSIEGARGAGKMVQELTLYKTGGLTALINNG